MGVKIAEECLSVHRNLRYTFRYLFITDSGLPTSYFNQAIRLCGLMTAWYAYIDGLGWFSCSPWRSDHRAAPKEDFPWRFAAFYLAQSNRVKKIVFNKAWMLWIGIWGWALVVCFNSWKTFWKKKICSWCNHGSGASFTWELEENTFQV